MAEKKQIAVGKAEDFPAGQMKLITIEGREMPPVEFTAKRAK